MVQSLHKPQKASVKHFPLIYRVAELALGIGGDVSSPHKTAGSRLFTEMGLKWPAG